MDIARRFVSSSVVQHIVQQQQRGARRVAGNGEARRGSSTAPRGSVTFERGSGERGRAPLSSVSGAVAVLDISGFSALCEQASSDETLMEDLCRVINGAFSKEVELAEHYGGQVLCFLGDGLLVFWPIRPREPAAGDSNSNPPAAGAGADALERAAGPEAFGGAMALRCARALQYALHVQEVFSSVCVGMGKDMKLRAAVAAGDFSEYFCGIGGATSGGDGACEAALMDDRGHVVPGRMVHFIAGPAIAETGDALGAIKQGETAVCASAQQYLTDPALAPALALAPVHVSSPGGPPAAVARAMARHSSVHSTSSLAVAGGSPAGADRDRSSRALTPEPTARGTSPGPASSRGAGAHAVVPATAAAREALAAFVAGPAGGEPAEAPLPELAPEEQDQVALYVPYTVRARLAAMREWGAATEADAFDPTRFLSEFRVASVASPIPV
eukprot:tig00020807_g14068.t1